MDNFENGEKKDNRRLLLDEFLKNKKLKQEKEKRKNDFVVRKVDPTWSSKVTDSKNLTRMRKTPSLVHENTNNDRKLLDTGKQFIKGVWTSHYDLARYVFDILAAKGQSSQKDISRTSKYWISRARFEESLGNSSEALNIYETAILEKIQPVDDILNAKSELLKRINRDDDVDLKAMEEELDNSIKQHKLILTKCTPKKKRATKSLAGSVSVKRTLDFVIDSSPDQDKKENDNIFDASIAVLTPVRATKRQKRELGVETVVTPVRRSVRNLSRNIGNTTRLPLEASNMNILMEETEYSYAFNKALGKVQPKEILMTPKKDFKKDLNKK
ncbi:hypothetical protein ROZALSC1DRAFT_27700 [Rozella allomycis CSF55]|uniref:Uncharacterized protein n=1 Tax=Rozella allomycis (strain CSF55) TaxID=988480 RepID=A0A4P9YMD6_ROZAC|nr:hypothetical protein ROZALSC1DRAFT_27700 [Rozella allomycis CSF55]